MTAVNLTCESPRGVEVVLKDVEWGEAYCLLFSIYPSLDLTFKIFDLETNTLALIIPAESLNCTRMERFHRLHKARKAYELNVEANVFCPAVRVEVA